MAAHPQELGVQMAATACLYNLSKQSMGQKIHCHWLSKMVELTMQAMTHFPNHQQLQKNALLTLCSDRILQDVVRDFGGFAMKKESMLQYLQDVKLSANDTNISNQ